MISRKKKAPKILQNITIEKLGYGGVGIARTLDGRKILVSGGVLPGAIIDVIVHKSRKDCFEGRVFFVHTPSPMEDTPAPCPHYHAHQIASLSPENNGEANQQDPAHVGCGGCKRQQVSYPGQLTLKQAVIEDSFRSISETLATATRPDILPSPLQRGYRNKIEYSFGDYKSGDIHNPWAMGFHKQGQFSQIIDIHECLLTSPAARKLFAYLKKLCRESGLPIYNHVKHVGFFRHLMVREGYNTGHFLINQSINTLSMTAEHRTAWSILLDVLRTDTYLHETVTTCIISTNNGLGDTIWNSETSQEILWGEGHIYEALTINVGDTSVTTRYRISAQSFFQTNTAGAELLFSTAASILGHIDGPLIDLYCGTGTIGIALHRGGIGSSLIGIEIVPDAIVDAHYNASINGITDAYFAAGRAEKLITSDTTFQAACENTHAIIVDPPRDGLHPDVVQFLIKLRKDKAYKLLYISCNPVTLARDIAVLSEVFSVRTLQAVDMFPHTHHIETICLLS